MKKASRHQGTKASRHRGKGNRIQHRNVYRVNQFVVDITICGETLVPPVRCCLILILIILSCVFWFQDCFVIRRLRFLRGFWVYRHPGRAGRLRGMRGVVEVRL